MVFKRERTRRVLAALDQFDKPVDLGFVERCVMHEFRELEVLPGTKRAPWFVVWWFRGFRVVTEG